MNSLFLMACFSLVPQRPSMIMYTVPTNIGTIERTTGDWVVMSTGTHQGDWAWVYNCKAPTDQLIETESLEDVRWAMRHAQDFYCSDCVTNKICNPVQSCEESK